MEGGTGERVPPETSDQEISDLPGKERQGKKGKWSRKEGKWRKGRWKIEMKGGKVTKWGEDLCIVKFFFFFCSLFFCFVLFCFFFAFHFWKPLKFVLGLPKWEFSTGKKDFTLGKKSGEMTLPLLKNIPLTPLNTIEVIFISYVKERGLLMAIQITIHQWHSHHRVKEGQSAPMTAQKNAKNLEKLGKNQENRGKIRKKRKNRKGSFTLPLLTDRAGYATAIHIMI